MSDAERQLPVPYDPEKDKEVVAHIENLIVGTDDPSKLARLLELRDQLLQGGNSNPQTISALASIDRAIQKEKYSSEIETLARARGLIVQQDEAVKDGNHRRLLEKTKINISIAACIFGTGLAIVSTVGNPLYSKLLTLGLMILGAGLSGIVPSYGKKILNEGERNAGNQDSPK